MAMFRAVQLVVDTGKPTGRVEWYLAHGVKDAGKMLLYTRRLKNARCRLGPTRRVVSCPDGTAWVVVAERAPGPTRARARRKGRKG